MPAWYEIRWLPNGPVEQYAGSRGNYYEFSETDRLDLYSVPVWCHRCARITDGENLLTVEDIDKQIGDLNDPTSLLYRIARQGIVEKLFGKGDEFLQSRITELQRRRAWRLARKSPAKCIHCGSIEIVMLPEGEPIAHPHGEGMIQIDCVGMCSTTFNEWFFTPEGDRIPRDTQPTYWHHPELDKPRRMLLALIKLLLLPLLYCLGLVVAGAYGALHNQISYTVAPSYFHGHKFVQFDIPPELHNRLGAALVGWHASWWMGMFVGPPVLLIGLLVPGWKLYLSRSLIAMGVVVATTLCVGLAALAYSVCASANTDPFDHAGHMHNFSYLGGFIGILTGSAYMLYQGVACQYRLAATETQAALQICEADQTASATLPRESR